MKTETAKHTPGPWKLYQPPYSDQFQVRDQDEEMIYAVVPHKGNKHQARADARLIAAAPELLEAAKNALEWLELALPKFNGPLDVGNETHQIALRAAIARAEGKP